MYVYLYIPPTPYVSESQEFMFEPVMQGSILVACALTGTDKQLQSGEALSRHRFQGGHLDNSSQCATHLFNKKT